MSNQKLRKIGVLASFLLLALPLASYAEDNKVMGQVDFVPVSKVEKSAGVWIDGQYVGHVSELKGSKKILLLPGDHDIVARQTGYQEFDQKVTVEPGKTFALMIRLVKDPNARFSSATAQVKIHVDPDRAAVFVDGTFAGYVHEFGGVGRSMLVSPGKHQIKIALPGYHDFTTEVNLLPNQKFTIETKLAEASINQADPAVKQN
jgi:hypothetical protein